MLELSGPPPVCVITQEMEISSKKKKTCLCRVYILPGLDAADHEQILELGEGFQERGSLNRHPTGLEKRSRASWRRKCVYCFFNAAVFSQVFLSKWNKYQHVLNSPAFI